MDSFALVVHDEQTFMAKVVNYGMEEGIFTRDRADEIIRISVAMANKYVLHKDVDFRSTDELAKVQETILKLIGIGLEIKSKGMLEEGIGILMDTSPVDLFRLAHTRAEKLRHQWQLLLQNHRIEILVSSSEYECLSELTCQRLSEMSIFTESEIHTIESLTLEDELFSNLGLLEYYETELERYEFILRMRNLLPFNLINRSPLVQAENLSEVDSVRHALINTLIISGCLDLSDPVAVSIADVRDFLKILDLQGQTDVFPAEVENVLIDLIQELGEGLEESEAGLLTKAMIQATQEFMDTIINEWDTVTSSSENTFFKRWCRLVILSDFPDPMKRILSSSGSVDEFDFEIIEDLLLRSTEEQVSDLIAQIPWKRLNPPQILRLLHDFHQWRGVFIPYVSVYGFSGHELVELMEMLDVDLIKPLLPSLRETFSRISFTMEDLELMAGVAGTAKSVLPEMSLPPADYDAVRAMREFKDASDKVKQILLFSCRNADFFSNLFLEAWAVDAAFVKRQVKRLEADAIGPFLLKAAGGDEPEIVTMGKKGASLRFQVPEVNSLFGSLPAVKKKAATAFFQQQ